MNIKKIVNSILNESLDSNVKLVTKKIIQEASKGVCEQCGSQLYEGECLECGSMKEEFYEEDTSSVCETYKYHLENFGEDDDRTIEFEEKCKSSSKSSEDELDEELKGGQHKLDVAEPKGKLTSADFKKLRSRKNIKKTKEVEEEFFYSDDEDAERASKEEPTYVGRGLSDNKAKADRANKILGSFNDKHGWYDEMDREYSGDFDFDFEEEEFSDFDSLMSKYGDEQRWFDKKGGKKFFDTYQKKYGGSPFKVRKRREMEEDDTQEGNAFTGALARAREEGDDEFNVGGKKFETKESKHKRQDKKTQKENIKLTESEMIDLIESIVLEEKEKKVLDRKKAKGYTEYEKNVKLSKKENDDYIKSVTNKLKDYLKMGSKGDYESNPKHFPKGNGQLEKMKKKAYVPSEAVEEFIEEFAYSPGMENLEYDEIKPNDEWIEMNLEGSSKTGNSSEYANAEKTDLGKKINEKRKRNLYGVEKKGSYKRVKQPVDTAGEHAGEKKLKNMFKKLGENEIPKEEKLLNEELSKMSDLIKYNTKTQ